MESEYCNRFLHSVKRTRTRNNSRLTLMHTSSIRKIGSASRCSSQEQLNNIINQCDSQCLNTRHLREQINRKDRELSSDFSKLVGTIRNKKTKLYDENYIAKAVKQFRTEKKAFIYNKGRFITGHLSSWRDLISN